MNDFGLDLAVIGNGHTAALLEPASRLVWWCYPRFDGDPVFSRLLAGDEEKGFCDVVLDDMVDYASDYERNTAIVSTILTNSQGASVRITDFAPRFQQFRPHVPAAAAHPHHRAGRRAAAHRHSRAADQQLREADRGPLARQQSHHLPRQGPRASGSPPTVPSPISSGKTSFVLTKPIHMVLGPDESFAEDIATTCREFADRTRDYWMEWVRRLSIAYDWQDAIIRAAISLKLSNFEETGGIVAALTTSIPEAPGLGAHLGLPLLLAAGRLFRGEGAQSARRAPRRWRDFISFILGIATEDPICGRSMASCRPIRWTRWIAPNLKGYRNDGPVRVGNAAVDQSQHDTFGSIILAAMPMFFDRRLPRPGNEGLFHLLETLGAQGGQARLHARRRHLGISRPHPRSHLFRRDVLGRLQPLGGDRVASRPARPRRPLDGRSPTSIQTTLLERAWSEKRGCVHRRLRDRRPRRERPAAARDRPDRTERSALREDRRRHRARIARAAST